MGFKEFYYGLENKYYAFLERINTKIPIHKLTDQIDKVMPSMIFFSVLSLVIIALIIWLIVASLITPAVTFEFYLGGTLVSGDLPVNLTAEKYNEDFVVSNGILNAAFDMGDFVTVKIASPYEFTKTYEIDSDLIKVDIPKISKAELKEEDKVKEISIYLIEKNGAMIKEQGTVNVSCDDFEKELMVNGQTKVEVPDQCNYLELVANVGDYLQSKKNCDTALCKILMDKEGTTTPTVIIQNFPKNKVIVYVKDNFGVSLSGFDVKITGTENIADVKDTGKTNEFGSYTFDEVTVGAYKLYVSDPSGTLATYSQDLEVTIGTPVIVDITLAKPPLGYFNVTVKTEDSNGFAFAALSIKDFNDNYLDVRDINTNQEYKIGVYEQKKYVFSVTPGLGYDLNYGIIEEEVEYDLQTGDKKVELVLSKLNYYNYTQVNLKVVKEKEDGTEEPLSGMLIEVEHASGPKANMSLDIGKKITDVNGLVSMIVPNGHYNIKADSYYFHGVTEVETYDNPAAKAMPETEVKIVVEAGIAKLRLSAVDEDGEKLNGVQVDVYMDSNYYGFLTIGEQDEFEEFTVEAYHNIYFRAHKDGYLDYVSPEFMLQKQGSEGQNSYTQEIVLFNNYKYLNKDPEMVYLGTYSDIELKKPISVINNKTEFYYAFELVVPEFNKGGHKISNIKLSGVAGEKSKKVSESDLVLKNVYGFGKELLYSDFSKNSAFAELNDDFTYSAKMFSEAYSGNSYVARILVHLKATDIPKFGEKLFFYYALEYNTDSGMLYLPEKSNNFLDKTYDLIKYLGKAENCTELICVNTFVDGFSTDSLNGGSVNKVTLVPGKENNVMISLTKGSKEPSLENNKFTVFNAEVNFNKELSELKNFFVDAKELSLELDKITSEAPIEFDSQNAPMYIKEQQINSYLKNYVLSFSSKLEFVESKPSQIYFLFDNGADEVIKKTVDIAALDKDPLSLDGLPAENMLIPMITNKFDVVVESGDDEVVDATIKVYSYDGLGWTLDSYMNSGAGGKAQVIVSPKKEGNEVKVVVEKEGYLPFSAVLIVTNNLFEYSKSKNSAKIVYPKDNNPVDAVLGIKNKTTTDFEITKVDFLGTSNLGLIFDVTKMENYFATPQLLLGNAETLDFKLFYIESVVMGLGEKMDFKDIIAVIHFKAPDSEEEIIYDVKFDAEVTFDNAPLDDGCVSVEFTTDPNKLSGANNLDITYLNGLVPDVYLVIENSCQAELDEGQGSKKEYNFSKFEMDASFSKIASNFAGGFTLNMSGYENVENEDYTLFVLDTKELLDLKAPQKSQKKYIYKIKINKLEGYELGQNGTKINFVFTPKYKGPTTEPVTFKDISVNLTVSEKELSECLYFGLNTGYSTQEITEETNCEGVEDGNDCVVSPVQPLVLDDSQYYVGGNSGVLRLGYEYEEETAGLEQLTLGLDIPEDADPISITREGSDYVSNTLPLLIQNNCGVELEVMVCKSDDEYCKIPTTKEYIRFDYSSISGFSDELYNTGIKLKPEEKIQFSLLRPSDFSGAVVLPLYVKGGDNYNFLKELKVSVQSSVDNQYFVVNPFVKDGLVDVAVYKNEYLPDTHDWEDPIKYSLLDDDSDAESNLQLQSITNEELYDYTGSYDGSGKLRDSFILLDVNSMYASVMNSPTVSAAPVVFAAMLVPWISENIKFKSVEYNLPGWVILKAYTYRYDTHAEDNVGDLGDDEGVSGEYRMWSESLPPQYLLNYPNAFDGIKSEKGRLAQTSPFFDIADGVENFGNLLYYHKGVSFPYFINIGVGRAEGDSGEEENVYAQAFCPSKYELKKLEIYRGDSGHADGRGQEFYLVEDGKTTKYIYGGHVNFDSDGINDDSDTAYMIMAVCRLPRTEFGEVNRQEIDHIVYGASSILNVNTIKSALKSLMESYPLENPETKIQMLINKYDEIFFDEAQSYGCTITPPGWFEGEDEESGKYELWESDNISGCPDYNDGEHKVEFLNSLHDSKENMISNYRAMVINSIIAQVGNSTQESLETDLKAAIAGSNSLGDYISDYFVESYNLDSYNSKVKNEIAHLEEISYSGLALSGGLFNASKDIRLYLDNKIDAGFSFYKKVESCPYGGYTGPGAVPTIEYEWNNVGKDFCVVDGTSYGNTNACDLVQFAKVVEQNLSTDVQEQHFTVKLMYDNYSEAALKAIEEEGFFENFEDIKILKYDGTPVGILNPGIYNVSAFKDDKVLELYISYVTSYGPDHIFYYMPADNPQTGKISGVGVSLNKSLAIDSSLQYNLSSDVVALAEYTVNNYDLEAINTSQKGAIFSGYFKDKLVYWNEPSIYVYSVIIEKDVNFDLKITSSEYGDEIYPLLKTGWIYTEEGTNYYAENGGIKFEVVDTVDGKRLRITNLGGENKKITRVFFYPTDVGISKDNLKKVTGLEIKTLRDLYKGIESGLVCYKAQEDGSEYYYNPLKILGEAMEVD